MSRTGASGRSAGGDAASSATPFTPPAIALPKGGGAIRGIGDKFAANSATGGGTTTIPIATSPGRSGFGPTLSLSYDSGRGNGPFGFGWSLHLPSITRKTDKGLPRYLDTGPEADVFILSGSEDLVPTAEQPGPRTIDGQTYRIMRYRPRTEGLFARVERWTNVAQPSDTFWRSISPSNVTTWYGRTPNSRVARPSDASQIFTWLVCESYDDKGNAIVYAYAEENDANVDARLAGEHNREVTAGRYLKSVRYGNRTSRLVQSDLSLMEWLFEVVFDYDEGHYEELPPAVGAVASAERPRSLAAAKLPDARRWRVRPDPFSVYRSGFETRTYRRCRRVLMFHSFAELGAEPCLVRATEFEYGDFDYTDFDGGSEEARDAERKHVGSTRVGSFIQSVKQTAFVRDPDAAIVQKNGVSYATYFRKSVPPVEFEYSRASVDETVREIDEDSLEQMPIGVDGAWYQFVDLDGEGLSGILTQQAEAWHYKRPLGEGRFAPAVAVASPNMPRLGGGGQLLDLAGDGQLDVVAFAGAAPGYFERTKERGWTLFRAFRSLPNVDWNDPHLQFIDLNGDGHADVLVFEPESLVWYPSLGEEGFGRGLRVPRPFDEEQGPQRVFSDRCSGYFVADMSGDGLPDLVRVRNGEVAYWPSLGYGSFGAKVTMDDAPLFDDPAHFDARRLRLADIDGTGATDLIYVGRDGVQLYANQAGNRWGGAYRLRGFPPVDELASVSTADLLGNGTACLVWSSALPGDTRRSMRYIDLMGGKKPHLLVKVTNNLGAETVVHYVSSTKFYLDDERAGRPWVTRLPFPVHVVERVETRDYVSRSRFVTRYAYHHGHFDGVEREFGGFGMVEQWDTESFEVLAEMDGAENIEAASHVPPVHTKTWFHTGAHLGGEDLSRYFAGTLDQSDRGEYYREPAALLDDDTAAAGLLPDHLLPAGMSAEEERQAYRALRGSMLRQEVYGRDGSPREEHPYSVTQHRYAVELLQAQGSNPHAVFFTRPLETLTQEYERAPDDPRTAHTLALEVDCFGNVLKTVEIAYGRRPGFGLPLEVDREKQGRALLTYTENDVTLPLLDEADDYRTPMPCETRTYELTGYLPTGAGGRFRPEDFVSAGARALIVDRTLEYEQAPTGGSERRPIEIVRTFYRKNDLTGLSPLGTVESLALPGESYALALTRGLIDEVFRRPLDRIVAPGAPPPEALLPAVTSVLGSRGPDGGGYVELDGDGRWWVPSGRTFYAPNPDDGAAAERELARAHFFMPRRYESPFGARTIVEYDSYDLLLRETTDPLGNRVTVGGRNADGSIDPAVPGNDYRVLQPRAVTTPNRNRTIVAFDVLGLVAGTAVQGKGGTVGDGLDGFDPDLTPGQIDGFFESGDPRGAAAVLLKNATTRIITDLDRFWRSRQVYPDDRSKWQPACSATIARETHVGAELPPHGQRTQVHVEHSDGFGRVIQTKALAEPGPVVAGGPIVEPRWVATGWTIFNNKGAPVRQYEPFFSGLEKGHQFEFGRQIGVSAVMFYDAPGRVVATLSPDGTYEKVVRGAWTIRTFDANDTAAPHGEETGDPRTDPDIRGYVAKYFEARPDWTTWRARRAGGALGVHERRAAEAAAKHAATPSTQHLDVLGRTFLTLSQIVRPDGKRDDLASRIELDIEGNRLELRDAVVQNGDRRGRLVMRHHFDMLGNTIHEASMESGERWTLNDSGGKPIRIWDSLGRTFRTEYDTVRRPLKVFVGDELRELMVYGEHHPESEQRNLRGTLWLHLDTAGLVIADRRDFKGNLLQSARRLAKEYKAPLDWSGVVAAFSLDDNARVDLETVEAALAPMLEPDVFAARTSYDALDRPVQLIPPHRADAGTRSVIQPVFNEANLLERIDVWLAASAVPDSLLDPALTEPSPVGVANIDHDAKGRRTAIVYKNGASTRYSYDPETFRLRSLYTRRGPAFTQDCTNRAPPPATVAAPEVPPPDVPCGLQQLHYTYDPLGNITHVRDAAQDVLYFQGQAIKAEAEYVYDSLNRLISASGRERLQNVDGPPIPHTHDDSARTGIRWGQNLGELMAAYVEEYVYDDVGSLASLTHRRSSAAHAGWTRNFLRAEKSQIEPGKTSNRITHAALAADGAAPERFLHDVHGNIVRAAHLAPGETAHASNLYWDDSNRLVRADLGGGGTAWYVYDASGQRVRKVWEKSPGLIEERIYLGGLEVFRRKDGAGNVTLERETLHIMDGQQRVALVETRTAGDDPAPDRVIRYQLGNHLGSAMLELDDEARIISYEEYSPYGSTTYQAVHGETETPKRYRYTGKERDEETGFYYHGARYYAPWMAQWTSADLAGIADGLNLYRYCSANPIGLSDPTGLFGWKDIKQGAASARKLANAALEKARALNPQVEQLNEDLSRVNRAVDLIIPGSAPLKGAAKGLADNVSQAITGKSPATTSRPSTRLSTEQRIEAATDAVMTVTPLAPAHHTSKVLKNAAVGALAGDKTTAESALDVAEAEPTGFVGKAIETEKALEKADSAHKRGMTGDVIRASVDAGTSFLELMTIGVSLAAGARGRGSAGGKGSSGAGRGGAASPSKGPGTYTVLAEAPLEEKATRGSRGKHYREAQENLKNQINAQREVYGSPYRVNAIQDIQAVEEPLRADGSGSVSVTAWHHHPFKEGLMQLVYRAEHQSTSLQHLFHPGGRGGFSRWLKNF